MNFAILEDEKLYLDNMLTYLKRSLKEIGIKADRIDTFSSGEEFLPKYQKGLYDVILLDIYMGEKSGIETAREIRNADTDVILVFCTSSNEFASESYEVAAKYYLQKPISEEKVSNMLKKLNLDKIEYNRSIKLPNGTRCLLRNIMYTEYQNHNVTFNINGAPNQSVYMSHTDAEALLLTHKGFHTVNKGCIVNFGMVKKRSDSSFIMADGECIPISRRRYKEISELYTKYHFEKLESEVDP